MPFEVPKGWAFGYGKDLFAPMQSIKPSSDTFYYADIESVDNTTNTLSAKIIKKEFAPSRASRYCEKGDLLFSMVRPYLKNIAMVNISNCIASTGFYICHSNGSLDKDYLFRMMLSDYVVNGLNTYMKGDNSPSINKINIDTFLFPVPPLAEQKRIMAEINRWFALIDTIEQGKENLEISIKQAKSKILDLAIHGKLVPQDPSDEPASELLKRINPKAQITCDNEHYAQLPRGWSVCLLEDIIEYEQPTDYIVSSTNYDDSYLTPVLTAGKSFLIGYTDEEEGIYSKLPCIIFDDFTTASKLVTFPFKVKSSAMKILQVNQNISIKYVAAFMSITQLIGDTHKRYWISEYSKLPIPIPPKEEQKRIVTAIDNLFNVLDAIMENL